VNENIATPTYRWTIFTALLRRRRRRQVLGVQVIHEGS